MNDRIRELREESFNAKPSVSAERAKILTDTYKKYEGKVSVPVLRALAFKELCERKTIYLDARELIVGERGPWPKACPTYPELTCHSLEDLEVLRTRPMTSYEVDDLTIETYRDEIIPYWRGRSIRDRAFSHLPPEWKVLYEAGMFTEFMEQRAAGHTALDGKLYSMGLLEFKTTIDQERAALNPGDPERLEKYSELEAMGIACEAAILFARRHAEMAQKLAEKETDAERRSNLLAVAETCLRVPAHAPRNLREALQAYWFVHLGTITELNGWDSMSPGHLDQHLAPFYEHDLVSGALTRESAKELLSCFWIKVNNTPAPPKVGVTAAESGTYNDFTNINLGGLSPEGRDGSSEVSLIALEVLDELRLLQPQANVQVSTRTPDRILKEACRVIRNGSGYPSLFNADEVILAQTAMGKSLRDAREGGTSGCIETGCFGKEAYVLHGYLNVPKILELALNDGIDPLSGMRIGPATGAAAAFTDFEELYAAFVAQLEYVVNWKIRFSEDLDRMYGENVPAPFLSVYISDCIQNGRDYYRGGARYNTDYIQCVGLGTVADSLSALKTLAFDGGTARIGDFLAAMKDNWNGHEPLRQRIRNKTPLYGNDDDRADDFAVRVLDTLLKTIEGRKSWRGGTYYVDLLSTTCHVYFGLKTGATPDGRKSHAPQSDGTSPAHGSDRKGPTAVMKSLGKLDQARTGGTLLNQRFLPAALAGEQGIEKLASLVRGYFRLGGHHVQFNVVDEATLRDAQKRPEAYRGLLVRVAGYSDYFVDLDRNHQEEIISRTVQEGF